VLFTTYTQALRRASKQLLKQLLTTHQLARVTVSTCDQVARGIVKQVEGIGKIYGRSQMLRELRTFRRSWDKKTVDGLDEKLRRKALAKIPDVYLLDEIDWIIVGRDLADAEAYKSTSRAGRGIPFSAKLRVAVWDFYAAFREDLAQKSLVDFNTVRRQALGIVKDGRYRKQYDCVVIDEAQDLTPVSLALLAELAASPEGIFLAADSKQSIYSRSYSWSSAHPRLQFRGRTSVLKRNYRSTGEIDRAAFEVLPESDDFGWTTSESPHSGPMPVLVKNLPVIDESTWAARFVRQMSRHLRVKLSAAAVLVPTDDIGRKIAEGMTIAGVPAEFFPGRELDLESRNVKVITLHSAKGLEFPTVAICGLVPGTYPEESLYSSSGEWEEAMMEHRRLLYVGMTRAMRGLMVCVTETCTDLPLLELAKDNWNHVTASQNETQ